MSDLAVAFGLVLVIEGSLWALAPRFGRKMLEQTADIPAVSYTHLTLPTILLV